MIIDVIVTPRAKHTKMTHEPSGVWKIWVTAPPVDGKANEEVRRAIAAYFQVPKLAVRILKGLTDRRKVIELPDRPIPRQETLL